MTGKQSPKRTGVRLYPPPSKDFDPFAATKKDLMRHGLPLRPDPQTQPGMAALWERKAERYRSFEHLEPRPDTSTAAKKAVSAAPALGPDPIESCGYQLLSSSAPFTVLFMTWTVPDLQFVPGPFEVTDHFQTFVGLGLLDVHVEMTVDSTGTVTSKIAAQGVGLNLPVRPGDVISGSLCLDTKPPGTAHYFLTNETTMQTINLTFDSGFPPAVTINAGVSRTGNPSIPPFDHPLARFGVVYFDEISAYTTSGPRTLTSGDAITMVDQNGKILARPVRLNDFAFKTVYAAG